jgi:hypothetical protein
MTEDFEEIYDEDIDEEDFIDDVDSLDLDD